MGRVALLYLTSLFNLSLAKADLPAIWKRSLVLPVLKPGKAATEGPSYRPISLLSCLSKVLEKIVSKRIVSFLHKQNFFSKFQFGFRKGLSTSHAISLLVNKITEAKFT